MSECVFAYLYRSAKRSRLLPTGPLLITPPQSSRSSVPLLRSAAATPTVDG